MKNIIFDEITLDSSTLFLFLTSAIHQMKNSEFKNIHFQPGNSAPRLIYANDNCILVLERINLTEIDMINDFRDYTFITFDLKKTILTLSDSRFENITLSGTGTQVQI
jgi:hypothetical protein